MDLPGCVARSGSVSTLIVGCTAESVVSEGWRSRAASSQMASPTKAAIHAIAPMGSSGETSRRG